MRKRRSPITALILLALGLALCLVFLLGGILIVGLPAQAARIYGPAAPHLDTSQRVRLSAYLLWQAESLTSPTNLNGSLVPFQIGLGEPPPSIATRLQARGLIENPTAFINYLRYAGLDTTIQAGDYELSPVMTPVEIAQSLQDATPKEVTFTILEGWRLEEIAASFPTSGLAVTPQSFLEATSTVPAGQALTPGLPTQATHEGFLLPGTYQVPREATTSELVSQLLDNFSNQVGFEILEGFDRQGLSLFQSVSLASIVEREAINEDEMPMIASVFINRLGIGMKLEADSTVQYALGFNEEQNTWWTNPLTGRHLQIDSAYNTYRYPALPPGPIANPGLSALRAVAFPAQTPYFFFRAACDDSGRHVFAVTFDEHLLNACPEDQ